MKLRNIVAGATDLTGAAITRGVTAAGDIHENFVDVPDAERGVTAFADAAGIGLSEFQHPQTNRLVSDVDSSLREKILDIPGAHRETEIEPNGLSNNVGMEAVAPA